MSFGYSAGDFITIGTLAWGVYKSCKGAPESFGDISLEVLSLHAVLKEAEETIFVQPLLPTRQERLRAVGDGCYRVLKDLDNLLKKYQSLGTQSKRTWDRMRWGTEDVAELRARLTSNTGLLTAWISMSQANVEKKLDDFLQEFREGKRQGSVISAQTVDSLCMKDKQVWRTIRKELEDMGITVAAFEANKDFIFGWFAKAVASGAFEEHSFYDSPTSEPYQDSSDEQLKVGKIASRGRQREAPVSLSPSKIALPRRRIPRVAALIAGLSRPNNSLIAALEEHNFSKACEILSDHSKVVWLDNKSLYKAMCEAVGTGQMQVVRLLLENGADINAVETDGYSALQVASENGHEQMVRLLLENGADVNAIEKDGYSALRIAAQNGHEQVVRLLLENGADVNAVEKDGHSALQFASQNGHEQVVRLLLENGADVNAVENDGYSALQLASQNRHEQIVLLLLENGADVNAVENDGYSALQLASQNRHGQIVQLLLEKGADVNAVAEDGYSPLCIASRNGNKQVVRLLLNNGADVNAVAQDGYSPLSIASRNGNKQVVRLLLKSGADVNAVAQDGYSALSIASRNGHEQVVQLLLENGANVNVRGRNQYSALECASQYGHEQIVRLLLENSANVNAASKHLHSALQIASQNGHFQVVRLLLEKRAHRAKSTASRKRTVRMASNK